jgi:hypothetical protein
VSLSVDISQYNADRSTFERNFAGGIGTVLSINPARVVVINVQPGSVHVEFYITPPVVGGSLSAEAAMAILADPAQMQSRAQAFAQANLGALAPISVERRPVRSMAASASLRSSVDSRGDSGSGGAMLVIGVGVAPTEHSTKYPDRNSELTEIYDFEIGSA